MQLLPGLRNTGFLRGRLSMNTAFSNTYQSIGRTERPSLFNNPATLATNEHAFSILRMLEPSRARRRSAWRIVWTTPLLSLAAVAVVVGLNGGYAKLASFGDSADGRRVGTESTPVAAAGQPQVPALPSATANAPVIAGEPSFTGDQTQADELASFIAEAENQASGKQPWTEAGVPVMGAPAAVAVRRDAGATKASFLSVPAKAGANHMKRATATATPAKSHARDVKKDKDVELIGALLAHVSAPAAAPVPNTPARKQQAAAATPARAAVRRDRGTTNEGNRTAQAAVVSTDALIKQCRSLGILQGELCRLRVCSNLWGKDPACPSSALTASDS